MLMVKTAAAGYPHIARMGDWRFARFRGHKRVRAPRLDARPSRSTRARPRRRDSASGSAAGPLSRCRCSTGMGSLGVKSATPAQSVPRIRASSGGDGDTGFHQRSRRFSTRLRELPTFLTAFFTAEADRPVFFDSDRTS